MPESLIGLTEGSGKNAHTFQRVIGANTVEDDVVIHGEQYLAGYLASTQGTAVSAATANAHIFQIMAGASLKVRIRRIEIFQVGMATAVTMAALLLVRLTTAGTGGTVLTPWPLDPADAASGATCMTLPTVKGTEGAVVANAEAELQQTLGASNQFAQPIMVMDFDRLRTKPPIIAAGAANGFALKNLNGTAAATLLFNIWLDESNF